MAYDFDGAYDFVVNKCNASNVGYSQTYRNEQTVGGVTYYDCSSLIFYALKHNGWTMWDGNAFTTATMGSVLKSIGFTELPSTDWQAGDILWRSGHTEMVYSGQTTMGAHSSRKPLAEQVSINSYTSSYSSYSKLYRFNGDAPEPPEPPEPPSPPNPSYNGSSTKKCIYYPKRIF